MKIAVIGSGLIGRKHIDLIAKNPDLELVAIVNPNHVPTDLMEAHSVPNFESHKDLINAKLAEAAIISSPNETHAEIAIDLMEAGVPILIEKPIAASLEECESILDAEAHTGVPVLVGHHRRYNPVIQEMHDLIQGGDLGSLVGFSGVWSVRKPDDYYNTKWRVGPSGGPIMINLIHEIEYIQAMVGPIRGLSAFCADRRRRQEVEATVSLNMEFESGALGTVLLSDSAASPWSWEQATGENAPTFPQSRENPYRFLFERGAVEFPQLKIWKQEDPDWTNPFETEDRNRLAQSWQSVFADQLSHFHDVVRGKASPRITARDGTNALNTALIVRRAISEPGRYLKVPAPRNANA